MPAQHDFVMPVVACPKIATARTWSPPADDDNTQVATFAHTVRTKANSIKYAQPKNVTVNIEPDENGIAITIADDGKGFDREIVVMGNGIHNMQKRIQDIEGDFDLVSKPNEGTKITIRLT